MAVVQDPKGLKLKLKANEAYEARKWKKALELYLETERHLPNDTRVIQRTGDLYRRLEKNDEAVGQYKKVAHMYANNGFWAKAIAINKIILDIDPNDQDVHRQLAEMYALQGAAPAQTAKEPPPKIDRTDRSAISISGSEPMTLEDRADASAVGGTLSIPGMSPRTADVVSIPTIDLSNTDELPAEDTRELGTPVEKFSKIPLLSDMTPDELVSVLTRLAVRRFPMDSLICEEGDVGSSMYIVSEGVVEVFTKTTDGTPLLLTDLTGGEFFGEYSLLTKGVRKASVRAKTDVELLEITSSDFDAIAAQHPRIWNVLEGYLHRRIVDTILRKSPVFSALNFDERSKLAGLLVLKNFGMNQTVMQEQTEGEEMFFVKSGSLSVSIQRGKDRVLVGELGSGDYFGEVAMLTGKPRTATVQTKTDAELFCLHRKDAAKVLKNNRQILVNLKSKMEERAKDTIAAFESYSESRATLGFV